MAAFVSGLSVSLRASAFTPKAAVTPARASRASAARVTMQAKKSASIPYADCPPALDGSLPADYGFDPLGFSNRWDINFLREAELKHGRICMLAFAGWIFPELVTHLPDAAYAETNPLKAVSSVGFLPMAQIFLLCVILEGIAYNKYSKNNCANPGDYGWDAFNLASKGGADNHYRVAEVKSTFPHSHHPY